MFIELRVIPQYERIACNFMLKIIDKPDVHKRKD